jgi:type I restriction enzyme M protein
MEWCDLHTILRLPTGIFYAQGVKTNVIFFTRGKTAKANTKTVWVYDMRANMPPFGKTRPLTLATFAPFERVFGSDPHGRNRAPKLTDPQDRWRGFSREQIAERNDNLDISWLRDDSGDPEDGLTEPAEIASAIMGHLQAALDEIAALAEEIGGDAAAVEEAAE